MNSTLITAINTPLKKAVANNDNKKSPKMNIVVELMTVITMWSVVSTFVILLGLTWV